MGGGNAQKSKTARERNLEKNKASKGSQLDTNKKAMNIQGSCAACVKESRGGLVRGFVFHSQPLTC